ncbi:unnamed protein product [Larinioides sclopetarius]|uniref:Uncharacterized protein n=1 Tax=Larinioides sclopetarius TaxID=280406 RepID=A0AAV2AJ80_9ARAC
MMIFSDEMGLFLFIRRRISCTLNVFSSSNSDFNSVRIVSVGMSLSRKREVMFSVRKETNIGIPTKALN